MNKEKGQEVSPKGPHKAEEPANGSWIRKFYVNDSFRQKGRVVQR